jgi:hypothetical protein
MREGEVSDAPSADASSGLEVLRAKLTSKRRVEQLEGIRGAARLGAAAAPLVPDLAAFLTSDDYVPCTALDFEYWGHAPLAEEAAGAIESIGVAPDVELLKRLMSDPVILVLPEASYDQGAYIGDYGQERLAPAGLAARLALLLGQSAFDLLPELFVAAQSAEKEIGRPARRSIESLLALLPDASPARRAGFAEMVERMAVLPAAAVPTTSHGFDLRDLAALCRKRLAAAD